MSESDCADAARMMSVQVRERREFVDRWLFRQSEISAAERHKQHKPPFSRHRPGMLPACAIPVSTSHIGQVWRYTPAAARPSRRMHSVPRVAPAAPAPISSASHSLRTHVGGPRGACARHQRCPHHDSPRPATPTRAGAHHSACTG